jgi:hypothetical protein
MSSKPARVSILTLVLMVFAEFEFAAAQTSGQKSTEPSSPPQKSEQSATPLAARPEPGQKTYPSPKEAADALYSAAPR